MWKASVVFLGPFVSLFCKKDFAFTPHKINMEPKTSPSRKGKSSSKPPSLGFHVNFTEYISLKYNPTPVWVKM